MVDIYDINLQLFTVIHRFVQKGEIRRPCDGKGEEERGES